MSGLCELCVLCGESLFSDLVAAVPRCAFFVSARPAILPSNSRMIPDEIRERFTAITLNPNPFAFIVGIMPLLAFYAIARVLRSEPCLVDYAEVERTARIA